MTDRSAHNPARVVIVGGGCAGMAAAWELAKQPGYEIHVYEKTPRLGGKGSSTREIDGRILEHGLHVWMGWYENAFRMMRECYAVVEDRKESGKPLDLAHSCFDEAFMPEPNVGLVNPNFQDSQPVAWSVYFPPNEGLPGTPMEGNDNPFTVASYVTRMFEMVKALILSEVGDMPGDTPGAPRPDKRSRSDEILNLDIKTPPADSTAALLNRMGELSKAGALTGAAALLQLVTILEVWLRQQNIGPKAPESTLAIVEAAVSQVRKLLRDLVGMDRRLRMKTEVIDIVLTIMIGLFTDRVMFRDDGLDSLNDFDYREWLRLHGATKTSLESPFIRAAYDFAFAYEGGDPKKPRLAAGVALRGGLRMFFTYRGAAFWKMRSGMGDAIFAPLYAVLEDWQREFDEAKAKAEAEAKNTGKPPREPVLARRKAGLPKFKSPVHFHFCHELASVDFGADGDSLTALRFACSGTVNSPLQPGGGWPETPVKAPPPASTPPLTRREDPRRKSRPGEFDFVIVATGIPDFDSVFVKPFIGKDAGANKKPHPAVLKTWEVTTDRTKTVATKSAQVWLDKDLHALGWRRGPGLFTCMGLETFDTYADMTHLLPAEARAAAATRVAQGAAAAATAPPWGSIAYFCNPLDETEGLPKNPKGAVKRDLRTLLTTQMDAFWPDLFDKGQNTLKLRQAAWNEMTIYPRANTNRSDRYALSLPGSIASRISPLDPGIDNMTVAGDWTSCGLDCGCVEAAVMSGMLAAAAISGSPKLSDIVGYDQP